MKIQLKNGYEGILECTYQIVKSDCEIRYHGKDEIVGSYDEAIPLKITANRRNAKMIYKVSDPKSLTVDEKGIIRAKNVGRYTVTVYIPEDGNYKRSNEIKVKVRIIPAKIKLQSAKAKLRRKISIKWIRDTKVQGYHISYSTNKNMLNSKTITIKKNKTTSAVLKNLKSKKKYYIEIYGYKKEKVGKRYTDVIGPVTKKTKKQNKNMLYNRKERVFAGGRNMRKIKRIIICVIMAFVMICVGNNAFSKARDIKAEETQNNELKGTYGDNLTWNFKDGVLKISGTGEIPELFLEKINDQYDEISKYTVKEIVIEKGVTGIGNSAFEGCYWAEKVTFPDGLQTIGNEAFDRNGLKELEIPESVSYIGKSAFSWCRKLEEVKLPENPTKLSDKIFYECNALEKVVLPNNLESIGDEVFYECGLNKLEIPESVSSIGSDAFSPILSRFSGRSIFFKELHPKNVPLFTFVIPFGILTSSRFLH